MKKVVALISFSVAVATHAQTVANTSNVFRPLQHKPMSSVDRDPETSAEFRNSRQQAHPATAIAPASTPARPAVIVAKIDSSLAASPIHIVGTVTGIKGRMTVTNIGAKIVTPEAQFAVLNDKGFQIGTASKNGTTLAPSETEEIAVVAANPGGVDLKLMKLSPAASH